MNSQLIKMASLPLDRNGSYCTATKPIILPFLKPGLNCDVTIQNIGKPAVITKINKFVTFYCGQLIVGLAAETG